MEIPYSKEEIRAATFETITRNGLKSCYIRPLVFRGAGPMGLYPLDCPVDVMIAVWEWGAYLGDEGKVNGVRAKVSSWRRISERRADPDGQGRRPVPELRPGQDRGRQGGLRGGDPARLARLRLRGHGREPVPGQGRQGLHARLRQRHPRGHQPRGGDRDPARPGLRGRRARHRARRALPRRRDLHDRHRGRADADPRGRRPDRRRRHARPDHDRDPGDLRGRAARALGALRGLAGQGPRARSPKPWTSSSTTPPCATGCRGRACRCPSRRRCASRASSTRSACPMIEAGFPTSNPKELELFERLREAGLTADVCAFGMTRRRGVAAEEDAALRVLAESWTPVSTIVGKTWGLHLEKVVKVDRDENLRDDRRVGRLPGRRRQARRLRRRALLRRLPRRLGLRDRVPARRATTRAPRT